MALEGKAALDPKPVSIEQAWTMRQAISIQVAEVIKDTSETWAQPPSDQAESPLPAPDVIQPLALYKPVEEVQPAELPEVSVQEMIVVAEPEHYVGPALPVSQNDMAAEVLVAESPQPEWALNMEPFDKPIAQANTVAVEAHWQPDLPKVEVMVVYEQIVQLMEPAAPLAESYIAELEPAPDSAAVAEAEPVVYMTELLELAPERVESATKEPISLEQIADHAEVAQPLEETLVELAVYFDQVELETLEPAEADRIEEIRQILQDIDEYLASPAYKAETEGKPRITPELTRQLLELLSTVGYKDPGETLVKFVTDYDLYTLIRAIRYLHQLSQASEQQELMARYGPARPAIGNMPGRWGRLLLSLMMGVVLNNQLRQEEV